MNVLVVCPYHPDSSPSLNVTLENGLFYCHGCGAKGLLRQHPELLPLLEEARGNGAFFTVAPSSMPPLEGLPKDYLVRRGFCEETLKTFEIGGNQDRVWIPVRLRDSTLVGIIFRFVAGEARYRYTQGFHKRNYLFGSRQFVSRGDEVFVVEGALDCIRMHQVGARNTVALLGNQPSSGQLDLMKSLGDRVVLAFDNDNAGWQSTLKVGKLLQHRGHTVVVLSYEGEDPGGLSDNSSFGFVPFLKFLLAVENARIEILR